VVGPHAIAKHLEWISGGLQDLGLAVLDPFDPRAEGAEDGSRADAQEAVAGPLFSALDTLEQECRLGVVDLSKQREWRFQVGHDLAHDRNMISLSSERFKLLGRGAEHGWSRGSRGLSCWDALKSPAILGP